MTTAGRSRETAVALFAKAPEPGQVKTRLAPRLGMDGAAQLHRTLVEHALATATAAGIGPVTLYCAPSPQHPFFAACRDRYGVRLRAQTGGDLGARQAQACAAELATHCNVIVIGSDCPALAPASLRTAAAWLDAGDDAVLAPAEDGGYVLIGLRHDAVRCFEAVAWGGPTVLETTRARFGELGWRWRELPTLWDIDRPDDYDRLLASGLLVPQ